MKALAPCFVPAHGMIRIEFGIVEAERHVRRVGCDQTLDRVLSAARTTVSPPSVR
jgi:hypothetical protein